MKYLIFIIILLTSINAYSNDYEAGVSYARVNQNLFGTIAFPMDAVIVDVTYWHDSGLGFKLSTGKSTETANSLYVKGAHYTNKIDSLWSGTFLYRYELDKWYTEIGFGKTDYKATWTVNEVIPVWGDNSADSDWSYYAGVGYKIEDNVLLKFTYADWYRKEKEGYGRETTRGFTVGFSYLF